nr:MAG TPA: hypothetical protein [Caudoviricetes sp.]
MKVIARPNAVARARPVKMSNCLRRQRSTSRPVSRWRCSGFIGSAPFHVGERTTSNALSGIKKARHGRRAKTTQSNAMDIIECLLLTTSGEVVLPVPLQ